jgi:cell wall-associated NlpC family hydrolase
MGRQKSPNELNAGDLVFFGENGKVTHVGIVSMNDGKNLTMIHSSTSAGIKSDNVYHTDYWNQRLLFGVDIVSSHFEEDLGMK